MIYLLAGSHIIIKGKRYFTFQFQKYSGVARVIVLGGANAEGVSHSRGVRGPAPPENFEI